ncbi:MAG: hypothetical protein O7G87_10795 [bacterium]|nr:hypothetical protein [bacterium]
MNAMDQSLYEIGRTYSDAHYQPESRLVGTSVRGGCAYALMLVASGDQADCQEAELIVPEVIAYQEQDTDRSDFGLFKTSPDAEGYTDQNWAAFCGGYLMHIPRAYSDWVSDSCLKQIEGAVLRACAFIQKRDVTPSYTNISLLSASVLTVAGEMYGASEYLEEGRRKVRELVEYINLTGGFQEYSSPTYYGVNFSALCWMGMFVEDEEIHDLVIRIQERMWRTTAAHFHTPTGQLAGPHSRAYGNLLQHYAGAIKYYLYKVLGDVFDLGDSVAHGGDTTYAALAAIQEVACPEDAREMMLNSNYPRLVEETVRTDGRALDAEYAGSFIQMTTYLTDRYALGTVNTSEVWYQRRNLMVYWKSRGNALEALTEQVRENDKRVERRDGRCWCVQNQGRALMLHDLSDLAARSLSAFSIVLTLESQEIPELWIGGKEDRVLPRPFVNGRRLFLRSGDLFVRIQFLGQGVGEFEARGEIRAVVDGVEFVFDLYRGEEIAVGEENLQNVFCAYALEVREIHGGFTHEHFWEAFSGCDIETEISEEGVLTRWRGSDTVLELVPTGESGAFRYAGKVDGFTISPKRWIEEPI